ncbi:MAG: VOC family protein [Pseudomonadota bacterium]
MSASPVFAKVNIGVKHLGRATEIYERICGVGGDKLDAHMQVMSFCGAAIELQQGAETGVQSLVFEGIDLAQSAERLTAADVPFVHNETSIRIAADDATGVDVQLKHDVTNRPDGGTAHLDHVALCVSDLEAAARRWESILAIDAEHMGIHPVSGGAFTAARLLLGERMVELISPVHGVASNMAKRLAECGEGPVALAVPVQDVDTVKTALEALSVRVFHNDPHWMVHPRDNDGVLLQLTSRINH